MLVSLLILPGSLLVSLAGTVAMVVVLSVTVATVVGPAILTLVGDGVNRWRIGRPQSAERSAVMRFVNGALRRPLLAALRDRRDPARPGGARGRAEARPAEPRTAGQGRARAGRTPN